MQEKKTIACLPNEILLSILTTNVKTAKDCLYLSLVCKHWKESLCEKSPLLWRLYTLKKWNYASSTEKIDNWYLLYIKRMKIRAQLFETLRREPIPIEECAQWNTKCPLFWEHLETSKENNDFSKKK